VQGAYAYVVRWRRTDANQWENSLRLTSMPAGGVLNGLATHSVLSLETADSPGIRRPEATQVRNTHTLVLRGIRVDDYVFGVSSVSADGVESPVASAVPGGAFRPYTPPQAQ
jgi:hypothetical protein